MVEVLISLWVSEGNVQKERPKQIELDVQSVFVDQNAVKSLEGNKTAKTIVVLPDGLMIFADSRTSLRSWNVRHGRSSR